MPTIEGRELAAKFLGLLKEREAGADVRSVAGLETISIDEHWNDALLLVTDRRLLVSKDRLFGRAKLDFPVRWRQVNNVMNSRRTELSRGSSSLPFTVRVLYQPDSIVQPKYAVQID